MPSIYSNDKKSHPLRRKASIHTDILDDLPVLYSGKVKSIGRRIPTNANPRRYRSSLMQFLARKTTPPSGMRLASLIMDGAVWIQLEEEYE